MANEPMQRGPAAQRVADNVRALRKARGLDLSDLSTRLADLGHPISVSGLSKLETGSRRVDVDDLAALAVALDVSPPRLLMPATADRSERIMLTPTVRATEDAAWRWATGDLPLSYDPWAPPDDDERSVARRLDRSHAENRPYQPRDADGISAGELRQRNAELLPVVAEVRRASEAIGWTCERVLEATEHLLALTGLMHAMGYTDPAVVARLGYRGDDDGER